MFPKEASFSVGFVFQDGDILASSFPVDTQVAYILSLGVVKEFRNHGVGKSITDCTDLALQLHHQCKNWFLINVTPS